MPPEETTPRDTTLDTMDAAVWAKEFMRLFGDKREQIDEALMIGWFANAIMRGWDERTWKYERDSPDVPAPA